MIFKAHGYKILLLPALAALLVAAWAGLLRMGWTLPPLNAAEHGPLMISGFLGTMICLERAIALSASIQRGRWAYAAPLSSGLGTLAVLIGAPRLVGIALMILASLGLVVIFLIITRRQPALFSATVAFGAFCWLTGNILWFTGQPIYHLVEWWVGFLVLTIAGERLELTRIMRHPLSSQVAFLVAVGLLMLGLVLTAFTPEIGVRIDGVSLLALGFWLLRYDIARKTVRQTGLTRFIALCLLPGYGWLLVGGLLRLWFGPLIAGLSYDALLHTVFLGFVLSMIFGHAPIILPSVLKRPVPFQRRFYVHLTLLHLSLIIRIVADLGNQYVLRQWSGMFNVIAILIFLGSTLSAAYQSRGASDFQLASQSWRE